MKTNYEIRYAAHPEDAKGYDTQRIRRDFLIEKVFSDNEVNMVYSMYDRMVVGGAKPVGEILKLEAIDPLKASYFLSRREMGIFNVGGPGVVKAGDAVFELDYKEALYLGSGDREVTFESKDVKNPAQFYFNSVTAHRNYPDKKVTKADAIVAGGAEAAICACGVGGFNAMHALSTRNDDPEHASRPFSASRDGFIMGEGAGCLILEELEHAKARGAKIYAEMVGEGMSADAYHITASHPEGLGACLVMQNALKDAGMTPEDIDYINVHGTSTPVGDVSEVKAIQKLFGEHAYKLNISSTKSMTGHLLGAAGAVEALVSVLAVKNDIIPPTINHEEDDKDENIDYNLNFTFNKAQKRTVRAALSNTFGFGGHNACVIFKKYDD